MRLNINELIPYFHGSRAWLVKNKRQVTKTKAEVKKSNSSTEGNIEHNTFTVKVMTSKTEVPRGQALKMGEEIELLLDSGSSDHIVNSDKYFFEQVKLECPINIKVGDSHSLKSDKIGNIAVLFAVKGKWIKTIVKNIFYVPNMKQNLLSVSSITEQNNKIIFEDDTAEIYNRQSGQVIAIATERNKLFMLQGKIFTCKSDEIKAYSSVSDMSPKERLHRILGHPNFQSLKELCNSQLLNGLPNQIETEFLKYEICLQNKMTNLPFKNNRNRANKILELIHTDVHGPITQTGYKGERYFVSFIDDFCKLAVVYCTIQKSQTFDCFKEYIKLMQN